MKKLILLSLLVLLLAPTGCLWDNQQSKESRSVNDQQEKYAARQPTPAFQWSLERHLVIELYKLRNKNVTTHTVWRSNYGQIEGDCVSMGFSIPYDTSLTNPLMATDINSRGYTESALTSIEQPEPNGIFLSKNTSATWVLCLNDAGSVEPVYVEAKVTSYPYPVNVDYERNRVTKAGAATATISAKE